MAEYLFVGGSLDGQVRPASRDIVHIPVAEPSDDPETYVKQRIVVSRDRCHEFYALNGLGLDCVMDLLFQKYIGFSNLLTGKNVSVPGVKSEILGIAAYSNDPCPPIANFSSKKVFDRCDREIMAGNFVRVDGKVVVQVTEDGTGDLVFSPYDKEELVRAYWMNSLEVVVPVSKDRLCACKDVNLHG